MIASARRPETLRTVRLSGRFRMVDRDAVGDHDPVDVGVADVLERGVGEERVGDEDVDLGRALLLQRPRAGDERAAGDRHVVADDRDLVPHAARDLGDLGPLVLGPHLVHDREARVDHLREADGVLRAAGVGRDRDDAFARQAEVAEVRREELQRGHVVDRDREEALDLARVEIHRQHAVDARELEHVGEEARRDRLARLGLAVLPRVRVPRDDGRDPLGRRELRRLDHEQELHEVLVHRRAAGLDEEDVGAADRLEIAAVRLVVRERLELDVAELDAELLRDRRRELRVRAAGEDHEPLLRPAHDEVLGGRLVRHEASLEARQCQLSRRRGFHASRRPTLPW